jgi:hypothetical protein
LKFDEPYQQPGAEYNVHFSFKIPEDAPPSDYYETSGLKFQVKVKTWYMIAARVQTLSKKNQDELEENLQILHSKLSQILPIEQRSDSLELCRVKQDLSGWCCVSPSFSRVFLQQEKSLYYHDEVIELSAIIDNSKCNVEMVSAKLSIEQIMNV